MYQKSKLTVKEALSAFFRVKEYWKERGTDRLHVVVKTYEPTRKTETNPTLGPIVQGLSGFLGFKLLNTFQLGSKKWQLVFETEEPEEVVAFLLEWEDSCKKTLRKYGLLKEGTDELDPAKLHRLKKAVGGW